MSQNAAPQNWGFLSSARERADTIERHATAALNALNNLAPGDRHVEDAKGAMRGWHEALNAFAQSATLWAASAPPAQRRRVEEQLGGVAEDMVRTYAEMLLKSSQHAVKRLEGHSHVERSLAEAKSAVQNIEDALQSQQVTVAR